MVLSINVVEFSKILDYSYLYFREKSGITRTKIETTEIVHILSAAFFLSPQSVSKNLSLLSAGLLVFLISRAAKCLFASLLE